MDTRGWTLVELSILLLLLGLAGGSSAAFIRRQHDLLAVRSAARALEGLFFQVRQTALLRGSAELVIEVGPPARAWIRGDQVDTLRLAVWEAEVEIAGGRPLIEVRYGPDGLGQVASRTIVVRVREAERSIVVSSYGRVEVR